MRHHPLPEPAARPPAAGPATHAAHAAPSADWLAHGHGPGARQGWWLLALLPVLWLAGCGSAPRAPRDSSAGTAPPAATPARPARGAPDQDGPEERPPPDLLRVPDAEPRIEPVRTGGPNKPYEVLGQAYVPLQGDPPLVQRGLASWYGRKFHGKPTATGELYNMYAMSAAHRTMPLPSYARVRNPANGREVVVRINDRGPFHSQRVIDLSYTAALKLGVLSGVATVEVERITYEAIRTGSWRQGGQPNAWAAAPANQAAPAIAAAPAASPAPATPSPADTASFASTAPAAAPRPATSPSAALALSALADPPPTTVVEATPAPAKAARGFWLQLGAFSVPERAVDLQQQVAQQADWLAPLLAIFSERSLHRLQAGPYASRTDAQQAADRLRQALQLLPAVVERR